MKIKNMSKRVTKRQAEAYRRKFGQFPENYNPSVTDTKLSLGSKARIILNKFLKNITSPGYHSVES